MTKFIREYSGIAAHLYWLVSMTKHPKQSHFDFIKMVGDRGIYDTLDWDWDQVDRETKRAEENEEFQFNN